MLQSDPGHHASDGNRRKGCTRPQPQPPSHTPASQDKKAVLTSRETAGCDSDHTVRRLSYSAINIEPVKAQLEPRSSNEDSKQSSCTCLALERRVWMDACARHQWSRGQQVNISAAKFKKRQRARAATVPAAPCLSRAHPSGAPAPSSRPRTHKPPRRSRHDHTTQGTRHAMPGHDGDRLRAGV